MTWQGIWKREEKEAKLLMMTFTYCSSCYLRYNSEAYLPLSCQLAAIRQGKDILQAGHPSHLQPKNYILTSSVTFCKILTSTSSIGNMSFSKRLGFFLANPGPFFDKIALLDPRRWGIRKN